MNKSILIKDLRKQDIRKLKEQQRITIALPYVKAVQLTVQREMIEQDVLGIPTTFYGEEYIIRDNADNVHPIHAVKLNAEAMHEYIISLCRAINLQEFHYYRKLKEKNVKCGTKIQFEDGKQAIIATLSQECPTVMRSLFYVPLKKDGSISKIKPRILYGNVTFTIID